MKNNNIYIKRILILLLLISIYACNKQFFTGGEKQGIKASSLFNKLFENELQYNDFLLKASGEFNWNDNKQNFQLNARIKHDSIIWISLRMMGIEGMRLLITTDSILMMDRINNQWTAWSFYDISEILDLDVSFPIVQSIFTNKFFFYPPIADSIEVIKEFNTCKDINNYCISTMNFRKYKRLHNSNSHYYKKHLRQQENQTEDEADYFYQLVKIYPEIFKPSKIYIENITKHQSIEIQYSKPMLNNTIYYPSEIIVNVNTIETFFTLKMQTERFEINTDLVYPFKIPANYKQMRPNE